MPPDPLTRALSDADMQRRVSAYPSNLTFHDLIARNKRSSAFLVAVMIALVGLVGAIIAGILAVYGGDESLEILLPSAAVGLGAGIVAAGLGALWSWFGGAAAILSMSGAREIDKPADPELFNVIDELRIAAGLPMPRIFVIHDSAMNAFATGRDPAHGVVAITTGLRQRLTRDELQGVMAHEMAHIRHLDIRFAMLMATMVGLIAFACDAFLRIAFRSVHYTGRRASRSKGAGAGVVILLIVAAILAILAPLAAAIVQMAYSRRREYLADAGAVELTRNPLGLAGALQKLADDPEPLVDSANRGTAHMFIVNPLRKSRQRHHEASSLFLSHPPVKDRIARLLALAR